HVCSTHVSLTATATTEIYTLSLHDALPISHVPKAGYDIKNSTYFIEDGSYLRLKNISLSYNITAEKLRKIGFSKLQPYFSASNWLTLTKYTGMDPEVNQCGNSVSVQGIDWRTYPHSRSFVLSLNLEF